MKNRVVFNVSVVQILILCDTFNSAAPCEERTQPNIVFILADDLGYNDVGYSPYTDVSTPFIDDLHRRGLEVSDSYVPFICTPSRAALMTGQYPYRYGLQKISLNLDNPFGIPPRIKLLPEYLQNAGYQTHMVGKWHIGYCKPEYTPLRRGFESFFGFYSGHLTYFDHDEDGFLDYWLNDDLVKDKKYTTLDFANYTVNLLRQNKDERPMFLYLSLQSVHAPLEVPLGSNPDDSSPRAIYREMVKVMDNFVKTVVNGLKETGKWENTILIFTSDNGGQPEFGGNNYPLRGTKHSLWEGGTKSRSFLAGKVPQGRYTGLFHNVDWLPTILSMANHPIKHEHIDGVDQWPALQNLERKFEKQPRKSFFYGIGDEIENGEVKNYSAVRLRFYDEKRDEVRDYKLINGFPGARNGRYRIHDTVHMDDHTKFPDGVLFDMTVPEEHQEKTPVNDQKIKTRMLEMIEREKTTGYHPPLQINTVLHEARKMTVDGTPVLKPGWC